MSEMTHTLHKTVRTLANGIEVSSISGAQVDTYSGKLRHFNETCIFFDPVLFDRKDGFAVKVGRYDDHSIIVGTLLEVYETEVINTSHETITSHHQVGVSS